MTKKLPFYRFAIDETQPLFVFADVCTRWHGKRKAKEDPAEHDIFAYFTTDANVIVRPIHPKAMLVILTEPDEIETGLSAPWEEAKALQRPLHAERLVVLP